MSTTINQQTLEQFITNKLHIDKILQGEAHRYGITQNEFVEANDESDDNVLDMDEMLDEETSVYEKLATLYQQELKKEQEAKEEEKKKEEADEQRTTGQGGSGV